MDAVLGVLSTVGGVFRTISGIFSAIMDVLSGFGTYIFLGGFFGLLLTFLWFIFRYLDKKKLTLPVMVFTLFFAIFLGGNLLMLSKEAKDLESTAQSISIETEATDTASSGDDIHI